MEATLLIFKVIAFASVIFSILFVSARVYASYVRKVDESFDKFADDCSCKVGAVNDQITDAVTAVKPARKIAKKRVSAIKDDKLVITPVEEKPKRGRKKKS
jgi:hypothetical protein